MCGRLALTYGKLKINLDHRAADSGSLKTTQERLFIVSRNCVVSKTCALATALLISMVRTAQRKRSNIVEVGCEMLLRTRRYLRLLSVITNGI